MSDNKPIEIGKNAGKLHDCGGFSLKVTVDPQEPILS